MPSFKALTPVKVCQTGSCVLSVTCSSSVWSSCRDNHDYLHRHLRIRCVRYLPGHYWRSAHSSNGATHVSHPFKSPCSALTGNRSPGMWYSDRKVLILVSGVIFVFPLTWLKRISLLGFSSFLAVIFVWYFAAMVVAFAFVGTEDSYGNPTLSLLHNYQTIIDDTLWWNTSLEFFQCAPIICFAFHLEMFLSVT